MNRLAMTPLLVASLSVLAPDVGRAELITNGNFTDYTTGSEGISVIGNATNTPAGGYTAMTGWTSSSPYTFLYTPGSADTTGSYAPNLGYNDYLWGPSNGSANGLDATLPFSGNFIASDGDPGISQPLQQTVTGLTAGQSYTLSFYWAGAQFTDETSATYESWQVSLGGSTQSTAVVQNAAKGFTGWMQTTMTFTADSSTDVLSFLAVGPGGLPPAVLLGDVSLTPAPVPEPSSLIMVALGALGVVGVGLRRRAKAAKV